MARATAGEQNVDHSAQRHGISIFQFETGHTAVKVPKKRGRPRRSTPHPAKDELSGIQGAFDFVQMDGQSKITDKDARRMIRRRAMINHMQSKKRKQRDSDRKNDSDKDTYSRYSPPPEIAGADPFNDFSIDMDPSMHELFKFCLTTGWKAFYTVEKYTSVNPMKQFWLEMALKDRAFFHTLLGCTCSYGSPKGRKRNSLATIKHLNAAISIVNKRIKRDEIPSDTTLVVVATMACVEKNRGAHENWEVHMKGLRQLVDLRGGLSALESQPLVMNKLHRADLCGSLDAVQPPYFSNGGIASSTVVSSNPHSKGFEAVDSSTPLNIKLWQSLGSLSDAMSIKKTLSKTRDWADAATVRHLVTTTQYTLLSVEFSDLANEACRLALIMFSLMIVNEEPAYLVYDMLASRLWRLYESHPGASGSLQTGTLPHLPP
ncbi:hypothetical protein N7470_004589 [Penicillium chermesinum]|nr:hypothetical protein N7470_004589 [Penicillium chermesinum]